MYYRIPIAERIIDAKSGKFCGYVVIDDTIGYKVTNHKNGFSGMSIEELKKMPSIIMVSNFYLMADSPEEAINYFFENCFGASCGSELPACEIDKKLPIIEIDCPRIELNAPGEIICGREVSGIPTKSGIFGFCVLANNAFPQNCDLIERIKEVDRNKKYPRTIIEVGDVKYNVANIKIS